MKKIYPIKWMFSLFLNSLTKNKMSALTLAALLLCQVPPMQAKDNLAEIRVSINLDNEPLRTAMREIEAQSGLKFFYLSSQINTERKVSVEANKRPLDRVLDRLFENTNISYQFTGDQIILKKYKAVRLSAPHTGAPAEGETFFTGPIPGPAAAAEEPEAVQQRLSGQVTDEKNQPLPGVSVVVKGTSTGTTTDPEGRYAMEAPEGAATLVFSLIGYISQEQPVDGQDVVNITLVPDMQSLDEVVVVGYGTARKGDLTGSIGSVSGADIARMAPIQAAGAIQGQVAGVNILKNNGKPGDDYAIEVRGLSSIGKSNAPLVVIDGVMGGSLNSLNPADIEKIDVLKDASATAIYGSRGSNGVIIVTTRKGKAGKNKITYDGYMGIKTPMNLPDIMDGPQFVAYFEESVKNGGTRYLDDKEKENIANGKYTDWVDLLLQDGMQSSHNISLSGGNENTTHFFSAGYLSEEGNVPAEKFERFTLKANIDGNINDWIKAGTSTYISYSLQDQGSNEALRAAYRLRPTGDAYDENGELQFWPTTSDSQTPNPLFDPKTVKNESRRLRVFGNLFVELNPLPGLSFRSTIAPYMSSVRNGNFAGKFSKKNTGTRNGSGEYGTSLNISYTLDNVLSYKRSSGNHAFNGLLAHSMTVNRYEGANQSVLDLPFDSFWYNTGSAGTIEGITSSLSEWSLVSYMGRFNYSFKDKYQLTLTGRADGSSKLAEGHKWAFFPSAAIAWRAGEEPFIRNLSLFSNLKFRLSYGIVGNDAVSPYSTQASISQTTYDWNGEAALGFAPGAIANRALGWEKSREVNLGIDFGFFRNRLSGSVDIYDRQTKDLILNRALPQHTGFGSITANIGSTLNRGVEVALNSMNIVTDNFSWQTRLTFSKNHNEIVELYGNKEDDLGNAWFIGEPIRVYYDEVFDGIWQLNEAEEAAVYGAEPGQVKVRDLNGDKKITAEDRAIIGSPLPDWLGGMTNTFAYKNFDLSFMIYTRQGSMIYSPFHHSNFAREWNGRYNKMNVDFWTEDNPSNSWPAPNNTGGRSREELKAYVDASFVRVQNITLGYTFPLQTLERLKMSALRLYLTVNNPLLFTDYAGFDPEWASQNTFNMGVSSTVYLLGVNISF